MSAHAFNIVTQKHKNQIITLDTSLYPETFVITDVHGCYLTLEALLKKMNVTDNDLLISCGDNCDRGKRIKELLDYLFSRPNTYMVQANHDFHFYHYVLYDKIINGWMVDQGLSDTINQLGLSSENYAKKLEELPYFIKSNDGKFVFCHATWNWQKNEPVKWEHIWSRWYHEDPYEYVNYDGPLIVHGHTPTKDPYEKINGKLIGIDLDGGAVYGGVLRGLRLSDMKIFEQPYID